jgi:autotransporter translocation and assembly factor TamB
MGKKPRKPRWILPSIGAAGLLVAGYFFVQDHVVDNQLRPLLQQKLADLLHSPVSLGSVQADPRGGVELKNLSFDIPASGLSLHALIQKVSIRLSLVDLLWRHKSLVDSLESVTVNHPEIFIRRAAPASGTGSAAAPGPPPGPPLIPFKKIFVRDGEAFFQSDAEKEAKPFAQSIQVQAFSDDSHRWGLWLEAKPPEPKTAGSLVLNGSVNLDEAKLVGKIELQDWTLAGLGPLLRNFTGWDLLAGKANVEVPFALRPGRSFWFDIRGHVQDAAVRAPGEEGVLFTGIQGRTAIRPTELTLSQPLKFQIGQTPWQASGVIPFDGRPVSLTTSTDSLYLSTLVNDVLKMKDLKTDGVGQAALTVTGNFLNPTIQGEADLGTSHVGDWQLDALGIQAHYEKGLFQLTQITGRLYEGTLNASGQVLLGAGQEPVSLHASLQNVQAKKVAAILGFNGLEGLTNAEVNLGGTLQEPVMSSNVTMDLVRTLRKTLYHYSIKNDIQLKDQKVAFSVVLNDEARLYGEFNETPEGWDFGKLSLTNGKRIIHFQGKGSLPKQLDKPIQMEVKGQDIVLQDLVFFKDQFPEVAGKVALDAVFSGTRQAPQGSLQFQSPDVVLGKSLAPGPLLVSLDWASDNLTLHQLDYHNPSGQDFSIMGVLGLLPDSPLDLKIQAHQMPLALLTEITNLNNLPQPFTGIVTGKIHFGGLRKNPIIEGDGQIAGLQVGDWAADQVDALITSSNGKVQIQKVNVSQGSDSLNVSGSWDTTAVPARMALSFSARHFQMGKGPYLTGDFTWDAQTGDPWFLDWKGVFASPLFVLEDANKNNYRFTDFSTNATFKDSSLKGIVALGKNISGFCSVDFGQSEPEFEAVLKIAPALLAESPMIGQFLPDHLKAAGLISGEVKIAKGTWDTLPLEGHFTVADGKVLNYDFDKLKLDWTGNRSKVSPSLYLLRDDATYSLSGTLEASPPAAGQGAESFWAPDSRINLNGPLAKEKLSNILSLLNVDGTGHQVDGTVDGNLAMSGTVGQPTIKFDLQGTDLRFDDNIAPTADLHFSMAQGRLTVGASHITLSKGQINIDQGALSLDPQDSSLLSMDLSGSSQDLPIAIFHLSSQIHVAGQLALAAKPDRPTFAGTLSLIDANSGAATQASRFDLSMSVDKSHIVFKPLNTPNPQLVGELDLSQSPKVLFNHLRLVNSAGSFSLDGVLDPNGECRLTSDAQNVPIEEIGKWFFPSFPVSGNGNYHLLLQGTLADPIFNTSFSIAGGQCGDLKFNLLSGDLKSKGNTLLLGSDDVPLVISKKGVYSFNVHGSVPFTFSPAGWSKIKNQEMDINAEMEKGDFSLILLTGLVKKASGAMDFSAHIGGTLDDPVLNMDLDLAKASLEPMSFAHSVDDLNGRIKVRDNHVAIDDLNGMVGQGRVFIWTPPLKDSKMVLQNFIPQYLDFRIRTVGDRGLYLCIPGIMRKTEWGEISFYGATKDDPMLIVGPIGKPEIHGTALLQSGHYTFPPPPDDSGKTVTYGALGNVLFDLTLVSGSNAWYSNDFAGQYLELKIDPGDSMKISGKDSDKTPEIPGIKCTGSAGSKQGFLRYLGQQFQLEEASLYIPKGKLPHMRGRATETIKNAQIVTAGGVRQSDIEILIDFDGTFGNVDFKLDSIPHLTSTNDQEAQQQLLLSYIMFGRDMTGYTREDLQQAYQQNVGTAAGGAVLDAIDRLASASFRLKAGRSRDRAN